MQKFHSLYLHFLRSMNSISHIQVSNFKAVEVIVQYYFCGGYQRLGASERVFDVKLGTKMLQF